MRLIRQLWLAILVLSSTSLITASALAQASINSDWLSSATSNRSNSFQIQSVSFLTVDKAYQLGIAVTPNTTSAMSTLRLDWDIAEGYYLYQQSLKLIIASSSEPLPLNLPAGQKKYDEYFEKEVDVYYSQLKLHVELPFAASELPLKLQIHSQGCADAGLCYPPQIQTIRVAQDGNTVIATLIAPEPTKKPTTPSVPVSSTPPSLTAVSTIALLIAIISAILGGVLLNLMPCVFPVLSLKALSLASAHQSPHRQHLHGWWYTLGSTTLFVTIASIMLTLRHAGYAIGWGFHLQSPVVTGALAYLFFVMALLLSGSYNLTSGIGSIGQKLTEGHSLKSSFFTGALACVVASPCTAPFMGGALGYAVTQPTVIALSVFAALGFGMALPFLLLSYYPRLSNHLPKPGRWMESFRQFLAFPLLLTSLWLLWVLGRQAGSDAVILLCLGATAFAFAAWLMRWSQPSKTRRFVALALIVGALSLLTQVSNTHPQQNQALNDQRWQPYTEQRLQQLLATGTPTFINLTADWCITCLANEKAVLGRAEIEAAFMEAGIVKLKGDWTNYNPEITNLLSRFGRNGVPLYLLYSGKADAPPLVLPQILSKQSINEAIASTKTNKIADDNLN